MLYVCVCFINRLFKSIIKPNCYFWDWIQFISELDCDEMLKYQRLFVHGIKCFPLKTISERKKEEILIQTQIDFETRKYEDPSNYNGIYSNRL